MHFIVEEKSTDKMIPTSGTDTGSGPKASATVEACLVFPIFFVAVVSMCMLFINLRTAYRVRRELITAAFNLSADAASLDSAASVALPIMISSALKYSGEGLGQVRGGSEGISLEGTFVDESGIVEIRYQYSPQMPVKLPTVLEPRVIGSMRFRLFSGTRYSSLLEKDDDCGEEKSSNETVYITETGRVYHVSLKCPSIRISLRAVSSEETGAARNASGGKYYPCERCGRGKMPMLVYLTEEGSRYHYSMDCGAIQRKVKEVSKESVADRRACRRCGAEGK